MIYKDNKEEVCMCSSINLANAYKVKIKRRSRHYYSKDLNKNSHPVHCYWNLLTELRKVKIGRTKNTSKI
jgi:hypothetical protein